ncbi:hypothetical protein Tco_1081008 [Tanacetum coccineum]|uniref:Uncharacterized protein n=1 Tax=Tanacetum coccineum TaxID=301880 RepID=A0ABQ5HWG3_9ASTR
MIFFATRQLLRHVEELVLYPDCFLCYTLSPEARPTSPAPALSNGFITFGSFNNLAKTLLSELSNEVGFPVTNTSFDALVESLLSTSKPFPQSARYRILAS